MGSREAFGLQLSLVPLQLRRLRQSRCQSKLLLVGLVEEARRTPRVGRLQPGAQLMVPGTPPSTVWAVAGRRGPARPMF